MKSRLAVTGLRTTQGYEIFEPPVTLSLGARFVYRIVRGVFLAACLVWFRLDVQGRNRLPVAGPYILAPVHRSNLDFMIAAVTNQRCARFMAKDSIWSPSWFAQAITWMGAFPVKRDTVDRAALRWTGRSLEAGDPVIMFPEGGRREGERVHPLQSGVAWTACRARVPVVPVGIGGSDRAMAIGSKVIRPVRIRVLVGEPMYPEVDPSGRVSRAEVDAFTERLHEQLQRLYDEVR